MLITFSSFEHAGTQGPINAAARVQAGAYGSVDWKGPVACRFKLLISDNRPPGRSAPASSAAHEAFIQALFKQDPRATVKTARAIYRGADDYRKQTGT